MENRITYEKDAEKEKTRATVTKIPPEVESELEFIDFLTLLQEREYK